MDYYPHVHPYHSGACPASKTDLPTAEQLQIIRGQRIIFTSAGPIQYGIKTYLPCRSRTCVEALEFYPLTHNVVEKQNLSL